MNRALIGRIKTSCPRVRRVNATKQETPIITTGSHGQDPFFSGRMRGIGIDRRRMTEHPLDLCPCDPVLPAFGPVALIPFESSDPDVLHVRRLHFCTYMHKKYEPCRRAVRDAGHRGSRVGAVGAGGEHPVPPYALSPEFNCPARSETAQAPSRRRKASRVGPGCLRHR